MIDTLRLTAEGAIELLQRGDVSAPELHAAYLHAIAERDGELHCYLRTSEEPSGDGIPIALKDVISTKGVETTAGSKILSGYVPVFDVAGLMTPVPGGVGPMTIALLLRNTLTAAQHRRAEVAVRGS